MSESGTTILAIDDVGESLLSIKHIINMKYELCVAKSAFAGLEILNNTKIDLVLLDLEMPEMNGFDFISMMRENPGFKYIPVIFVTGTMNKEIISKAGQAGANGYIVKPVKPDVLLEKIKSSLHPYQYILNSLFELQEACTQGRIEQAGELLKQVWREMARPQKTTEISVLLGSIDRNIACLDLGEAAEKLKKLQPLVREKLG
ncbi:MAG: response regulator [Spirochaetaceae bacterium]|jgi:CheY-like chemotaxis protein|nr:response regulator [Spirochaetaceae bacterium]